MENDDPRFKHVIHTEKGFMRLEDQLALWMKNLQQLQTGHFLYRIDSPEDRKEHDDREEPTND